MGFADKIVSTIQNATSTATEKIDETGYNMKIEEKKRAIDKLEEEIGDLIYKEYKNGKEFDAVSEQLKKIDALNEEISAIENQKKENSDKAYAERQKRREETP